MKGSITLAIFALALAVFAGSAAARPCGKDVIDDWYDNGTMDHSWSCECLRDAIDRMPDVGAPYAPARDDFEQLLGRQGCDGAAGQNVVEGTVTEARQGGTDRAIGVSDDSFRWDVAVVGGLTLALAALVAVAVWRQWRRRD